MNRIRRPVNDALLATVMYMIRESLGINNNITGKTYEMVEAEARERLYTMLDAVAGPPRYDNPAPPTPPENPKPYWVAEYEKLFRALEIIRNRLGLEPDSANGLDLQGVVQEVDNLMSRVHRLQAMVQAKPRAMGQFEAAGPDWNSVVYHIGQLVKVNWRGEKP
jgi:hypothetical protein